MDFIFGVGKKTVKLEISTEEKTKASARLKRSLGSSGLELKLDELRKELSSNHGGILPHSVLSTQQISLLCSQKPNSLEEASFIHVLLSFMVMVFVLIYYIAKQKKMFERLSKAATLRCVTGQYAAWTLHRPHTI